MGTLRTVPGANVGRGVPAGAAGREAGGSAGCCAAEDAPASGGKPMLGSWRGVGIWSAESKRRASVGVGVGVDKEAGVVVGVGHGEEVGEGVTVGRTAVPRSAMRGEPGGIFSTIGTWFSTLLGGLSTLGAVPGAASPGRRGISSVGVGLCACTPAAAMGGGARGAAAGSAGGRGENSSPCGGEMSNSSSGSSSKTRSERARRRRRCFCKARSTTGDCIMSGSPFGSSRGYSCYSSRACANPSTSRAAPTRKSDPVTQMRSSGRASERARTSASSTSRASSRSPRT